MENRKGVLNCKEKTFTFRFRGELFMVNLDRTDLRDNWNAINISDGAVFGVHFEWESSPKVTLHKINLDRNMISTEKIKDYPIKVKQVIGTKAEYFEAKFDGSLDLKYHVMDRRTIIYKSREYFKAATYKSKREAMDDTCYLKLIAVDSNGATKELII